MHKNTKIYMENLYYMKGKIKGSTQNKFTIIKSITIIILKFISNLRFSPTIIIYSLLEINTHSPMIFIHSKYNNSSWL